MHHHQAYLMLDFLLIDVVSSGLYQTRKNSSTTGSFSTRSIAAELIVLGTVLLAAVFSFSINFKFAFQYIYTTQA
jgi:hypothetical protein